MPATWPHLLASYPEDLVYGLRLLLGEHGAADRHDQRDDAVDPLGALVLGRLEIAGGVLGDGDVGGQPITRLVVPVTIRSWGRFIPPPGRGPGSAVRLDADPKPR